MDMLEVIMLAMMGRMVILGMKIGMQMVPGSKSLQMGVICNTLFMKQESQLVTYAAGPVKSTVDYYRVMHYSAKRGLAITCHLSIHTSVCLSVCLSVTLVDHDHVG